MFNFRVILLLLCTIAATLTMAAEMTPSITTDILDISKCEAFVDGQKVNTASPAALSAAFNLSTDNTTWNTGAVTAKSRHFRIAFNRPVTIGTVITPDYPGSNKVPLKEITGTFVSILKSDAPYPGDVMNNAQWITLRTGMVKYLPKDTKTRALRFSDVMEKADAKPRDVQIGRIVCLQERYYNACDLGRSVSNADLGTSELSVASWRVRQLISGAVLFMTKPADLRMEMLDPAEEKSPDTTAKGTWVQSTDTPAAGTVASMVFPNPATTWMIKVRGPIVPEKSNGVIKYIFPLSPLGDRAESPGAEPQAPYSVNYNMPMDGFIALDIHDKKTGKLVRRLVGETPRDKGMTQESWDLKDMTGTNVPPGEYTWNAIARPQFKLTYEMTLYNSGIPAWWAPEPAKGGGGWLADHCPGSSVAAIGDRMWISSPVAESGHSLMATDLDGVKQYGAGMFPFGFDGPHAVTGDDRFGYALTTNYIYRIDTKNKFAGRSVFNAPNPAPAGEPWAMSDGKLDTGANGITVRDGKLYLAISGKPLSWLKPSFTSEVMDPKTSIPFVYLKKGRGKRNDRTDRNYDFYEADELMKFYAAFMTDKTPAETPGLKNEPLNNVESSLFGDAPTTGALANSLVLALKEPSTIGSVIIPDAKIKVWVMKPGKKMKAAGEGDIDDVDFGEGGDIGGDDDEEDNWIPLTVTGKAGSMGVAIAPEGGIKTSALRIGTKRINFTLAMPRRFDEVSYLAERVGTEGNPTPKGGWMVTREGSIIQPTSPVSMAYVWKEEMSLRGMLFFEPTAPPPGRDLDSRLCVDIWTGENDKDPKTSLEDDTVWRQVAVINIGFAASAYPVDFGEVVKTRALRVRMLTSAASKVENVNWAGFTSAAILRYLGGDPEGLPQSKHDRVAILKLPEADSEKGMATLERYILLPKPSQLAFNPNGTLYAVSDGQIVTVPLNDGETSRIIVSKDKFSDPTGFACDAKGMIYVTDGKAKVIKVFDPANGALIRTIGKPGGYQSGKWDPSYLVNPLGITVDKLGRVWVADFTYTPKRIQRFAADGKPDKSFLGPTQYGGGGTMDSRDRRYVYYQGMKFVIDWEKKSWELDALLGQDVQRTVYHKNRRYLVGPIFGSEVALITEERNRVAVPMAACGVMSKWQDIVKRKDLRDTFGSLDGSKYLFVWWDKNADSIPQAAEVQVKEIAGVPNYWTVGEDLTFLSPGLRIRPSDIQANGIPAYDMEKLENLNTLTHGDGARNNRIFGDDKGRTFVIGTRLIDADGKQLWEYYNEFAKHDGFYAAGFGYERPPGVLNQEHNHVGHIKVKNAQGIEEEYFITNSDEGDWFCYTNDGMLVGCILGGTAGYGKKTFSMPEWEPGKLDLTDLRPGQEHYQGCVVYTDGNVYAIAGHNHMSIVRVEGLEKLQRMQGEITVTPDDINKTHEWQIKRAMLAESRKEPKIAKAYYLDAPAVNVTGILDEWPADAFFTIHETVIHSLHFTDRLLTAQSAIAFDEDNLYVAYRSKTDGPFRNSSQDAPVIFKNGDAAEITLAFDTKADPRRMSPVSGDMRIVFSLVKGKPTAVLFMPIDQNASADKSYEFTSPVGKTHMDHVELLKDARVAIGTSTMKGGGTQVLPMWTLEASIPWKSLGVAAPKPGLRLRGDMGILQADGGGMRTVNRIYWSGKSQTVVADLPSEARLTPSLWGDFDFTYQDKTVKFKSENPDEPEF